MPYYIYKIHPLNILQKLEQHDSYRAASQRVKAIRQEISTQTGCQVRIIFAENELAAEDALNTPRNAAEESGEDY